MIFYSLMVRYGFSSKIETVALKVEGLKDPSTRTFKPSIPIRFLVFLMLTKGKISSRYGV